MPSPSGAEETISISPPSVSRSSSALRKTSLSSMTATRIGTRLMLFGREQHVIVALAAFLHLHLDPGVALGHPAEEPVQPGGLVAGQDRPDAAGLGGEPIDDGRRHVVEGRTARDRFALVQPEKRPLLDAE